MSKEAANVPAFCSGDGGPRPLRVLWIWHAAVVAEYQKPLGLLGRCPDMQLSLLVPERWPERAGQMVDAEAGAGARSGAYRLIKGRTLFTGLYYIYLFPSLLCHLLRMRPDVIYCYEEPHTLMAACVLAIRRLVMPGTKVALYAAQNIRKSYPPPFGWFERYSFRQSDAILACGTLVAHTLRAKGYRGRLQVVALPVDTDAFAPDPARREAERKKLGVPIDAPTVGYAGKLVEEKGVRTLFSAFERVASGRCDVHLLLAGDGPLRAEMAAAARGAGLGDRVHFLGVVHNDDLPGFMNALDVFVLPSETRRNWREQFGRVLVEAMSSGVALAGSDSGEIPVVLGDAGCVFPEGDAEALAAKLSDLLADPALRAAGAERGRRRALALFSMERVSEQHYTVYRELTSRK